MSSNNDYANKTKDELLQLLYEKQEVILRKNDVLLQKDEIIIQKTKHIEFLEELHRAYQLRQFGNQSEKISNHQISIFNEAELPKNAEKILKAEEEIQVASYTYKKPGRKALPAEFPRVQRVYDLDEEDKICKCGCTLTHIKDEKSEQLELIPAKIYVIEHIRKKYACRSCEETIKTAKQPIAPIPRSIAASGLLSHVITSKYQDHLPLYRQEKIFKRIGVDLPRSTLCLWIIKCAELLKPLMKAVHEIILNYDIAYSDETTCQVLKDPRKGIASKKYMWMFAGGPPDKFSFYYQYHPNRNHEVPYNFFKNFKGYIHCDGFAAYDTLAAKNAHIALCACLYHVRRKFIEVVRLANGKEGVATNVVAMIAKLSQIEKEIKDLTPEDKLRARQNKSKPIFNELNNYLLVNRPKVPPKSLLGKAIGYALNQWEKLMMHLCDGRLDNNNNLSERAIKPFVIGRKGWMFSDSVKGAESSAILYSLVETCKHHNVEAYDWFRYVLDKIPICQTSEDIEALLPFNVDRKLLVRDSR